MSFATGGKTNRAIDGMARGHGTDLDELEWSEHQANTIVEMAVDVVALVSMIEGTLSEIYIKCAAICPT